MYVKISDQGSVVIEYDVQRCVMLLTVPGIPDSPTYRQDNLMILEVARRYPVHAIVCNLDNTGFVLNEDQKWIGEHILPELIRNGLRFVVYVLPNNVDGLLSLNRFTQIVEQKGNLHQRWFQSLAEAEAWVNAVLHCS